MGKDLQGKELSDGFSQRQDGLYYIRVKGTDGKRKTLYGKTMKEVKIKYNEYWFARESNQQIDMTLRAWTEQFISIYKTEQRETTKIRTRRLVNKMIYPILGDMKLSEVRNVDIMEWICILKKSYKPSTINKAISALKEIYYYAIHNDLVEKNPLKLVKNLAVQDKEYQAFTKEDQSDFEEYMAGRYYYPLVIIALNTGLRVGEIGGLQLSKDIDMDKKLIYVNHTLVYEKFDGDETKVYRLCPPKTKNSKRVVPMNDRCYEAMKLQLKRRKVVFEKLGSSFEDEFKDYLFISTEGHPVYAGYINNVLNSAIAEINKCRLMNDKIAKISFHLLRHTFATRGFEAGISIKTMQKLLGHSSIRMTMDIYTHVFRNVLNDEIGKLDDFIDQNHLPESDFGDIDNMNLENITVPNNPSNMLS